MMDFEKELCLFEMMVNGLIAGVSGGVPIPRLLDGVHATPTCYFKVSAGRKSEMISIT